MTLFVNGEEVPTQLIAEEMAGLRNLPNWKDAASQVSKAVQLHEAAENGAIDRVLLRQESEKDKAPVDPAEIDQEMAQVRAAAGCRTDVNEAWYRANAERQIRFRRTMRRLLGDVRGPSRFTVHQVYRERPELFEKPEEVHAAHIVCHVDDLHPEDSAKASIELAEAELEAGAPFDAVADRHSDCKAKGSDQGFFTRGVMVQEFENAVFALKPGERSGIFRTPFGFHIAEVRGRRGPCIAEFEEVAPRIERALLAAAEQKEMRRVFKELRRAALISRVASPGKANAAGEKSAASGP